MGIQSFQYLLGDITDEGVPLTNPPMCSSDILDTFWPEWPIDCTRMVVLAFNEFYYHYTYGPTADYDFPSMLPNWNLKFSTQTDWSHAYETFPIGPKSTGNGDAIALMWQGKVQGWEYVGSMSVQGIEISYEIVNDYEAGYIPSGAYIDDIILYKANTRTFHRLDEEASEFYFNNILPAGGVIPSAGMFSSTHTDINGNVNFNFGPAFDYIPLVGDVNLDGTTDVLDIISIINQILGTVNHPEWQQQLMDINSDNTIDVVDIIALLNNILGYDEAGEQLYRVDCVINNNNGIVYDCNENIAYDDSLSPTVNNLWCDECGDPYDSSNYCGVGYCSLRGFIEGMGCGENDIGDGGVYDNGGGAQCVTTTIPIGSLLSQREIDMLQTQLDILHHIGE